MISYRTVRPRRVAPRRRRKRFCHVKNAQAIKNDSAFVDFHRFRNVWGMSDHEISASINGSVRDGDLVIRDDSWKADDACMKGEHDIIDLVAQSDDVLNQHRQILCIGFGAYTYWLMRAAGLVTSPYAYSGNAGFSRSCLATRMPDRTTAEVPNLDSFAFDDRWLSGFFKIAAGTGHLDATRNHQRPRVEHRIGPSVVSMVV